MRTVNPSRLLTGILAAVLFSGAFSANAEAGTYRVTATCGNWDAVNHDAQRFAVYPTCPVLTARNSQGDFRTGPGTLGGWVFSAPPGTAIDAIYLSGAMVGVGNWQSTIYLEGGPLSGTVLEHCPGAACPGDNLYFDWKAYGGGGSQAIIARVRCGSTGGCSNAEVRGGIRLWNSNITIADSLPPAEAVAARLPRPGGSPEPCP